MASISVNPIYSKYIRLQAKAGRVFFFFFPFNTDNPEPPRGRDHKCTECTFQRWAHHCGGFLLQPPGSCLTRACHSIIHARLAFQAGMQVSGHGPAKRQMEARPGPKASHPDPPPAPHSAALTWAPNLAAAPLHMLTLCLHCPLAPSPDRGPRVPKDSHAGEPTQHGRSRSLLLQHSEQPLPQVASASEGQGYSLNLFLPKSGDFGATTDGPGTRLRQGRHMSGAQHLKRHRNTQ